MQSDREEIKRKEAVGRAGDRSTLRHVAWDNVETHPASITKAKNSNLSYNFGSFLLGREEVHIYLIEKKLTKQLWHVIAVVTGLKIAADIQKMKASHWKLAVFMHLGQDFPLLPPAALSICFIFLAVWPLDWRSGLATRRWNQSPFTTKKWAAENCKLFHFAQDSSDWQRGLLLSPWLS